jgi:hypothetical protein
MVIFVYRFWMLVEKEEKYNNVKRIAFFFINGKFKFNILTIKYVYVM